MATYYLDYENGNDANDGLSFANRWKTMTTGATAARIAPGDTIRIMGSPDPTSLGIGATWTGEKSRTSFTITGATNATPIVCTLASHGYTTGDTVIISNAAGNTATNGVWEVNVLTSSTFELVGSTGNGTWISGGRIVKINNRVVRLNSALTQNIASTGLRSTGWSPNANVSTAQNTSTTKEHYFSDQITISASFTTGVAAYYPLPTTLNLSAYQQVSFWIYQSSGTLGAAGACSLVLCSDTAGAVAVNTIDIPLLGTTFAWHPITVNTGGALGSSIQSIALKVNTDNGTQTFQLSNIIACKAASSADSLTLASLIGKGTTGETWYGIQSINGTRVILDNSSSNSASSSGNLGYFPMTGIGITENVTTYKRETIKTVYASSATNVQTFTDSGTAGNLIRYEGGWDRTNMSTQNLETWFDGSNGNGNGIYNSGQSYVSLNRVAAVRYANNFYFTGTISGMEIPYIPAANNSNSFGIVFSSVAPLVGIQTSVGITTIGSINNGNSIISYGNINKRTYIDNVKAYNNSSSMAVSSSICENIINNLEIFNCSIPLTVSTSANFKINYANIRYNASNITFSNGARKNTIGILTAVDNGAYAIVFFNSSDNYINGGSTSSHTTAGVQYLSVASYFNYLKNFTINEATEFTQSSLNGSNVRLYSHNHDNTSGNHVIFTDDGKISSETTIRNTASGLAWKLQPTSTSRDQYYPLDFSLAKIAVNANSLVSVSCWMRRDNTGLTMQLVVPGSSTIGAPPNTSPLAGIPNAGVISSMTAAADTWEQVSLSFTPTEQGVVEIFAYAYGGSTYTGYVDDLTITQA
jgi:hypothetical protein